MVSHKVWISEFMKALRQRFKLKLFKGVANVSNCSITRYLITYDPLTQDMTLETSVENDTSHLDSKPGRLTFL